MWRTEQEWSHLEYDNIIIYKQLFLPKNGRNSPERWSILEMEKCLREYQNCKHQTPYFWGGVHGEIRRVYLRWGLDASASTLRQVTFAGQCKKETNSDHY